MAPCFNTEVGQWSSFQLETAMASVPLQHALPCRSDINIIIKQWGWESGDGDGMDIFFL